MKRVDHKVVLTEVLNTVRAIQVNIQLVRIFNRMRVMPQSNQYSLEELEQLWDKFADQNEKIELILDCLKQFDFVHKQRRIQANRTRIG